MGDYSYYIKPNEYVPYGFNAENIFTIDRKQDVDEIVGNLIQDRERLEKELMRGYSKRMRFYLLMEENSLLDRLISGDYRSKANVDSVVNSLLTFTDRYNIIPMQISKKNSPKYIICMCRCNMSIELTESAYTSRWR